MKPSSAKQKGRLLQQWVAKALERHNLAEAGDVESRPMGSGGEDVIMGNLTRANVPYSFECKNVERVNIWSAYAQAGQNCNGYEPLVILKRNQHKPLALVDADHFFILLELLKCYREKEDG